MEQTPFKRSSREKGDFLHNILTKTYDNSRLYLFFRRKVVGGGNTSHILAFTVCFYKMKIDLGIDLIFRSRAPRFIEKMYHSKECSDLNEIEFEANPAFQKRFIVYADRKDTALKIFNQRNRNRFIALRMLLEKIEDKLYPKRSKNRIDQEKIRKQKRKKSTMLEKLIFLFVLMTFLSACIKAVPQKAEKKTENGFALASQIDFAKDFPGFKKSYGPKFYDKETIFDYINGGAEVYLQRGFIRVMTFELENLKNTKDKYAIDIYDMGSLDGSRSIFNKEKISEIQNNTKTGDSALSDNQIKSYKNNYYMKVTSYGEPNKKNLAILSRLLMEKID